MSKHRATTPAPADPLDAPAGGHPPGHSHGPGAPRAPSPQPITNPAETAARQRTLILRVVRIAFLVLLLTITLLNVLDFGDSVTPGLPFDLASRWWIPILACVLLAAAVYAADHFTRNKKLQTFGGIMFGLVAGLILTLALGFVVDLVATSWDFAQNDEIVGSIKVLLGVSLCYLAISTVLQTQDDFRLVIPYVEFAKTVRGPRPMLLDTSALIDARIADVAETGVFQAPLVVPQFVVEELQRLADSADRLKRAKGRRGLDIIARMQRSPATGLVFDATAVAHAPTDLMLVELARQLGGVLVTGDLALIRVAGFHNVPTLNIHALAAAMKPALAPGETLRLDLIRPGEQPGQAVGYLDDGTMIVCEDGAHRIGAEADVIVRTTMQTAAGRLVFARLADAGPAEPLTPSTTSETPPAHRQEPEAEAIDPPSRDAPAAEPPLPTEHRLASLATSQPRRLPSGPFPEKRPDAPRTPRSPRR